MAKQQYRVPPPDVFGCDRDAPLDQRKLYGFTVYKHLRDDEGCERYRRYIRRIWRRFRMLGLNDPKLEESFADECPSRIWEMYLAYAFYAWGWELIPSVPRGAGFDFGIRGLSSNVTMWIEATAPGPGDEASPNKVGWSQGPFGLGYANGGELQRTQSLRIAQVMEEKRSQYVRALDKNRVAPGDGFVVTISGSCWDNTADVGGIDGPPVVARYLFGLGSTTWNVELGGERRVTQGHFRPAYTIQKRTATGATDDTVAALFATSACPEVSAVIFCPNHIKNYPARLGSDLIVVHNPFARVPFPRSRIRRGEEWWVEETESGSTLLGARRGETRAESET